MKKIINNLLLCCTLSVLIFACTKNGSSGNSDYDAQSASDFSLAESVNNDVAAVATQTEENGVAGNYGDSTFGVQLSPCATVSIDNISTPHKLIIDFGESNCLCYDNKYRRGKALVSYTGLYRDSASSHTITFDNYYVDNYKVEGTTTVVNNGHNDAGNLTFSVNVSNTITDTSGRTLTYTSTRTREWVAGESTKGLFKWVDDVYSITGTANGTGFDGTQFTADITSPLIVALNCLWIEKGTIDFKPAGKLTRTIDFGNGDCDNKITVTIAGITVNLVLL